MTSKADVMDGRNKPCFSAMASRYPPLTPPINIDQVTAPTLMHAVQIDPYRAPSERYRWLS
ncbi:MAG: hypothetical protein AAGI88_08695 [Pseudomonadota bacterium]